MKEKMKYIIFNLSDFVPCPGNILYVKFDTIVRKFNRLISKFVSVRPRVGQTYNLPSFIDDV